MTSLFRRIAAQIIAWLGVRITNFGKYLTGYGLYFVFRYGTEKQAEVYLAEAMQARTQTRVVFVPVLTNELGVPTPAKGGELVN